MKFVAVCNGKGGCGKSTIATALAAEYQRRGLQTLIVDCDAPQYTALRWAKLGDVPAAAVADLQDVPRLGSAFDRVVIDTAGRDDDMMRGAMMLADLVLIPVQPTPADMWAAADAIAVAKQASTIRPGMAGYIVLSRVDARTSYSRQIRTALANTLPILAAEVHQRTDYAAAMQEGQGPSTFAPQGKAAAEIRAIFEEIEHVQANTTRAQPLHA